MRNVQIDAFFERGNHSWQRMEHVRDSFRAKKKKKMECFYSNVSPWQIRLEKKKKTGYCSLRNAMERFTNDTRKNVILTLL